jgi:protein disulfide-isomerase
MAVAAIGLVSALASCAAVAKTQTTPAAANGQWLTSYDAALAEARKSGKPVLAYFTGPDSDPWADPWSWKLRREVFDQKAFKDWAAKNVVLLELVFPFRRPQDEATTKANAELAKKYNVEGCPTVVFMNADGTQLGQSGYDRNGPKPWIENAKKILDAKKPAKP